MCHILWYLLRLYLPCLCFTLFIRENVFEFPVLNKYLMPSVQLCFEFCLISYPLVLSEHFVITTYILLIFYHLSMRTLFSSTLNRLLSRRLGPNLMSLFCKHFTSI